MFWLLGVLVAVVITLSRLCENDKILYTSAVCIGFAQALATVAFVFSVISRVLPPYGIHHTSDNALMFGLGVLTPFVQCLNQLRVFY